MFGLTKIVVFVMSVVEFLSNNFSPATLFPSWSQRLLAASPEAVGQKPSYVMSSPAPTIQNVTTLLDQIATTTLEAQSNALVLIPDTIHPASPSLLALAKEAIDLLYISLPYYLPDAGALIIAFLVAALLLAMSIGIYTSTPTITKSEDHAQLESHIYNQDALIEEMRTSHKTAIEEMRTSHKTAIEEMRASHNIEIANHNHRLTLQVNHTYSVSAERNRLSDRNKKLDREVEHAWNMELMAKYKSTDEVLKLEQEISRLRTHIHGLDDKFEAAEDTIAAAEEANEKVTDANERALVATQKTQEANQKVTAAEKACELKVEAAMKANKKKIARERQNAQAHIDKLRTEIETQKNNVRIEEYKVQELKRENKELGAKAREAAAVPNLPSFVGKTTATAAEETRRRLQALPGPESPRSPAPTPAIVAPSSTTAFGPRATPITTPAVRQTKGPRPRPTVWIAAGLPNPIRLVQPPPPPIMPKTKNSRGK
ncbi:hypothetical protein JADG_000375 [Aureobasidium aubasidani]|nr:hypothetical protein JADG_000375 [Aureobasidium pullulans]